MGRGEDPSVCKSRPIKELHLKILFLDDDEQRHKRFMMNRIGQDITAVWTFAEACDALQKDIFDVAYLDHDLSELAAEGRPAKEEKTGTDVADFIAAMEEGCRPRMVVIHSFNDYGRRRMKVILEKVGIRCMIQPFNG